MKSARATHCSTLVTILACLLAPATAQYPTEDQCAPEIDELSLLQARPQVQQYKDATPLLQVRADTGAIMNQQLEGANGHEGGVNSTRMSDVDCANAQPPRRYSWSLDSGRQKPPGMANLNHKPAMRFFCRRASVGIMKDSKSDYQSNEGTFVDLLYEPDFATRPFPKLIHLDEASNKCKRAGVSTLPPGLEGDCKVGGLLTQGLNYFKDLLPDEETWKRDAVYFAFNGGDIGGCVAYSRAARAVGLKYLYINNCWLDPQGNPGPARAIAGGIWLPFELDADVNKFPGGGYLFDVADEGLEFENSPAERGNTVSLDEKQFCNEIQTRCYGGVRADFVFSARPLNKEERSQRSIGVNADRND